MVGCYNLNTIEGVWGTYSDALKNSFLVLIITGMDRPEWASITGMDFKINLFYAIKFKILPLFMLKF